ncbi:MAG: hypothetical protein C4530_16195 [Desulfobacteraceae bacterium]|nr:MAG: hypothetical protein C4530_16195 [Desulfobacteraceae bacterium]
MSENRFQTTTAVIVAAGMGTRFNGGEMPKPLLPVVGMPMIARVMASAAKAGIRRFIVVIGYGADRMRSVLPGLVPSGCRLQTIENPHFRQPNGVSLMSALEVVQEPFALLMSDHVFSYDRLTRAIDCFAHRGRCLLVVEEKEDFDGDIEDATRVRIQEGRVTAIGKGLAPFDGVDTGMFILVPDMIAAALASCDRAPSISEGMQRLAKDRTLDALSMHTGHWQDIDTVQDLEKAEQKLYRSLRRPGDGVLARLINRRISLFLSTRIWRFGISPNMVTGLTLLLGIFAGVAFAQGSGAGWGLLGAALFQLQSIIDGVDGELARLMHKESRLGFWLDLGADNFSHMMVFGGIAVGLHLDRTPGPWLWLGSFSVLGVAASVAAMAPLLNRNKRNLPLPGEGKPLPRPLMNGLIEGLSQRDFTYLLFPLAALGWLGGFLWVAAVGTWLYALTVVILRIQGRDS